MGEEAFDFLSTIDPLKEAIAYETLLALKGATELNLEKSFSSFSMEPLSPSKILEEKKQNGQVEEIKNLYPKIEKFIKEKPGAIKIRDEKDILNHLRES